MMKNPKRSALKRFLIVISTIIVALCAAEVLFLWYFAHVEAHSGISHHQQIFAAKTLESLRDLEDARAQSKDVTLLPLTTQKNIIVLEPATSVWEKSKAMGGSALQVKVETGRYKGMVVWVRTEDIFVGGVAL